MKAQETVLKHLLEGKRQYVVPLYQRRYSWSKSEWEPFWSALRRQYQLLTSGEAQDRPAHFFGSFVVQPIGEQASGLSSYAVIDGQQRFATVFVLLVAIRDLCPDKAFAERVNESYLINKWDQGDARYKVRLGVHDRDDLEALVNCESEKATGPIGSVYRWLVNAISVEAEESGTVDFDALERTVISRMEVVDITTNANDNVHRIFQTLNSTGRRLTEVDLLRNHFFMLLPTKAEQAFKDLWAPMEEDLGARLDFFLWVDLVSRGGGRESLSRMAVYTKWQEDLEPVEHSEALVYGQLVALTERARSYVKVVHPDTLADPTLRTRVKTLAEWGATVHHPVMLKIMVLLDEGIISTATAVQSVRHIESFLVRRLLTRQPTNNLNRIFTTTVAQVPATASYAEDLRRSLSSPGKYWPTDHELQTAIGTEPFYWSQRPAQRQFVLRRLEESLPGKEKADWDVCNYTVEHVMPQHLSTDWYSVLEESGETDPVAAHTALVHTLGNLTLTCDNSILSDSPIERKQQIFDNSMLRMNRLLKDAKQWTRSEINKRAETMCAQAIQIWPGPVSVDVKPYEAGLQLVADALARLPEARWTSLDDLADAADAPRAVVRDYVLSRGDLPGRECILSSDGGFDTSLPWVIGDLAGYKMDLVGLGILDDSTEKVAPASRQMTGDDLAMLLGDA